MKKVVIASTNPVKVKVAGRAFSSVFPNEQFEFIQLKSESGVPEQPFDEQTLEGARNRVAFVKKAYPNADYWIGQEGGVFEEGSHLFDRAWIAVCDKDGFASESSTAHFRLPIKIKEYIAEGMELGEANDKFFNAVNSKQGLGAVGHLTDGLIDRTEFYLQAAILAVSEIKHKEWYM